MSETDDISKEWKLNTQGEHNENVLVGKDEEIKEMAKDMVSMASDESSKILLQASVKKEDEMLSSDPFSTPDDKGVSITGLPSSASGNIPKPFRGIDFEHVKQDRRRGPVETLLSQDEFLEEDRLIPYDENDHLDGVNKIPPVQTHY